MLVGRGIYNLFRGALPPECRNEEMVLNMKSHFVPYYNDHICDKTRTYPGITEMLRALESRGIAFALLRTNIRKVQKGLQKNCWANLIS
jgi:phosphoglycolate phosphatase